MPNAQAGADALRAVQDAIGMYMGLRQQRIDNQRRDTADSRAARQLELAEDQHATQKQEHERNSIEFLVNSFGGQVAAPEDAARARQVGYGSALEPEMTLASRSLRQPVDPTGPGAADPSLQAAEQRFAGAPTGRDKFKMPEGERTRIAYYNAAARGAEGNLNRENRIDVANIGAASREKIAAMRSGDAKLHMSIQNAALGLRKYGIDVSSMDRQRALAHNVALAQALMPDRDWDNFVDGLQANPLGFLQFLQPGAQFPQPPSTQNNYWNPGIGGGTTGPARPGTRRFEEIK